MKAFLFYPFITLLLCILSACDDSPKPTNQDDGKTDLEITEIQDIQVTTMTDMSKTDQMLSFTDQLIDAAVVEIEDQFLEPDLMVDLGPLTVNSIIPNRGSIDGATDVQIIGTGFSPTTVFTFDRIICQEIEVLNKNKAKCKTPANPVGEVDVKALDSRVENGMQVPYQGFLEKGFQYYIPLEVDEITPNKGAIYGGLRVTFSGRGFENPTQVKFGGIRSNEIVINENNTLTVTVPQAQVAGFVDVSVSNLNGQINLPSAFYYYEPLNLDQVVPAVGSSQGGTRVILQGTGFRADSNILFNDRPAQILGGSSTSLEVSTPSGNAGYADIKISNQNGELLKTRAFLYYDSQNQDFSVIGLQPQSGSVNGGETVYIAGSGFDAQTTVYFDGALISCRLENAYQLNCTTPPGIAGTIGVEVRKGNQNLSAGDYRYFQDLELFSIFPDKGSIAGGTVVTLNGRGFVAGMEVLLGDQPLLDLQIQDEFTVIGTTQPAPLSTVDVIAKTADRQQRLIGGYQYFDPTSGFGGVWGSELDAAINVTVLHATSQMPLAEVDVFLITNDGNLQLSGQTNASGQVTLSSENLRGLVDITAAKEGFEVTTIENTAVENVTIFLVPNTSEMGPQPPGVPPAILRGTVRGLDLLPKPNNETFVNLVIVETTHDNLTNRGDLPPPGPGGVLLEDGPFEITSRLGELAVIATAGRILRSVYVQFQNGEIDHMTFREQLEPISMGMRRFISAREGEEINGLHIEIDHPLDFIIPVDLDNPPLDRVNGPSVYAVLPILNLGGEGFWQFYGTAVDLTPNLSLNLMPRLAGWEDDLRYYFVGLAINPNSQSQSPLTITTHQTRDVAAGVLITPFVSPAKPINPVEDGTLGVDRLLAWSNYEGFDGNPTAPAEAMVVSISEPAFGPPKPLWKYVVPPGINQVEIPVLPTTAGEGTGLNGGAMILQMNPFISESGFNYRDFNYFDINGSRWKSWGVTQFFFNE